MSTWTAPVLVRLPLAKKDVASLLDTTPESLSRQLRRLTEAGVIEQRGARTRALREVARAGPGR